MWTNLLILFRSKICILIRNNFYLKKGQFQKIYIILQMDLAGNKKITKSRVGYGDDDPASIEETEANVFENDKVE